MPLSAKQEECQSTYVLGNQVFSLQTLPGNTPPDAPEGVTAGLESKRKTCELRGFSSVRDQLPDAALR